MPFGFHDAVESLAYWHGRRARLPWWRVAARREAARMTVTWERRLRAGVVRAPGLPLGARIDAAALVARTMGGRWARRAAAACVAGLAGLALLAGASFALLDALLRAV
jgi:hypothetical protein